MNLIPTVLLMLVVSSCAPLESESAIAQSALSPYRGLASGSRSTLVDGIVSAENLLFSADGRLFASGDEGVFEMRRENGAITAALLKTASPCKFTGMTEVTGVLYASCYDLSASAIYAARLTSAPDFRLLLGLPGVTLANGLTHDDEGRLYVAQTMQNQITRVTLDANDPFQVVSMETWLSGSGLFTNGLKIVDSVIYWTDFGGINRARIRSNGDAGRTQSVASALTFFDDLSVDSDGLLVADYLGNRIRAYTTRGSLIAETSAIFTNPSSVLPAQGRLGLGPNDLVLTEKTANRIAVYHPL